MFLRKAAIKFILLLWGSPVCLAQINTRFIEHLESNGLQKKHHSYLSSSSRTDSVYYFTARYHLKYFNDSLFLSNYLLSPEICRSDKELMATADSKILRFSKQQFADDWFRLQSTLSTGEHIAINEIYKAAEDPNQVSKGKIPAHLADVFAKYRKQYNKRPFVAGALSTVVPGLGKLYTGKPRSALMTFVLHCGYAVQTIESSRKLGNKHPLTVINVAAFGIFYLSNIYGSFTAVKDLKREYKKQFIHDATQDYN